MTINTQSPQRSQQCRHSERTEQTTVINGIAVAWQRCDECGERFDGPPHPKDNHVQGEQRTETDGDLIAQWEDNATAVAMSFSQESPETSQLVSRCMSTADLKTRSLVGQVVAVVGFFAHVAELTDAVTGEVQRKIRCVLVLDDGRTVSTMSKACVRQIAMFHRMRGGKPWDPPIYIETREFQLEAGKSYCDMREVPKPTKAKK